MELRQAIQAFRNAEAAGDVEAASRLARFIDQNLNQEPQPAAPAPESGVISSTIGGFKRLGAGLETAAGSIVDPQGAAQRGLQRQQELSEQYAPGASLDRVKQAYEKSGLLSAAGEAISQIPSAFAEQLPNIAATIAGGKAGAMAGTAIAPGIGTVVGGLTGAAVPSLLQLYGSNLVRQAEETPQDISRLSALGAAVPGTALEVASTAIPLGRTFIGKILGPEAEKMLARGTNASLERAAKESVATSLVRGGGVGALAEIPTEVTQQMLERLQAGLPLTTDDALAEYAEAAYGATLVGTPFGAIARTAGRSSVQQEYAALKQQEDARLAVSEEELAQRFPDTLPGGFKIEQEELGREMGPQGYNIMAEGREQPLSVVDTEEEATAKLEALTKIRAEERENLLKEEGKINAAIQKAQQNLERLEATEQTDTDEYRSLKAQLPTMMDESAQKIKDTYDKIEALSKPLSVTPFGEVERVNSQFKLFGPDSQQVGVFKTREQAEGAIEQSIGEDTFKQAKENQAAAKELYKTFVPQMRKFGLGDVGLNIVDRIENGAGGAYLDKLIRVSLEDSNPVQTMRHESLHALKDLGFFTPQQWKALERQAKKTWIEDLKKISQEEGKSRHDAYIELFTKEAQDKGLEGKELDEYVNNSLIEEAIADAFGAYDKGAKPPPGMIAALYRKIKNFFANLSQALRGAGFQSADDIFQAVERGELKPAAKAKPEAKQEAKPGKAAPKVKDIETQTMEERLSLLRAANPDEIEISTQNPQGKTRKYDPITQMLSIDSDAIKEAMETNKELSGRITQAISEYGFVPKDTAPEDVIDVFKKNIINNLVFLHNKVPKEIRERSKLWYDGANVIADQMADQYDMSLRQVAGIMAAMSPQKDWFQNVSMAERAIDILTNEGDSVWTPEMLQYADSYVKETDDRKEREKRQEHRDKIQKIADRGVSLKDMNAKDAAAFIRAFDEAFNSRQYRIVTPEGGFGDLVRNNDGTPSTMMWSTYGPIEKTVNIFRDGSRTNVSQQLGFEHKIRSFYNNIAAPNSEIGHVTIDTHAVAAALFEALAGTDTEVIQNFGGTGKSDVLGVGGTYGLIADAYRDAAKQLGLKPRELQSITWEAVRGLFSEEMKASLKPKVRAEWAKYKNGDQTFNETRENILKIAGQQEKLNEPDWVGSGEGQSVDEGGTSYDKDFVPEGGVRLRAARELKERAIINLSAASERAALPGINELYNRARNGDVDAYKLLQNVAGNSLKYLLNDTNARIKVKPVKGVYMSNREPAIVAMVTFKESESQDVLARIERFAENYEQEQIHVRVGTNKKPGHDFGDGSYATPSYTIKLQKELTDAEINDLIEQTGLPAFSVEDDTITTYWVAPNEREQGSQGFNEFAERVKQLNALVGESGSRPQQRTERLYVYGSGFGARISYERIQSDLPAKEAPDLNTPRMIAGYLFRNPVKVFKQKSLTLEQKKQQRLLAQVFNDLPVNDLRNPLVRQAYEALARALEDQFKVLPIKVELQTQKYRQGQKIPKGFKVGDLVPPYSNNSSEMRRDISENNHLLVYPTSPETFGPEGSDFSNHPLLKRSDITDVNGTKLLYNDLLRAVHDYYAHGMAEAQFGPAGEYTAWANHMAATADPMARWALTAETRSQNAWQNFTAGAEQLAVADRPYADQKAALPPVNYLLTGDKDVDAPVLEMIGSLDGKQLLGSLKERSKTAPEVRKALEKVMPAKEAKLSLRRTETKEFKDWLGRSKIVNKDGTPMVMYHGLAKDTTDFTRKTKRGAPIFLTDDPTFAETFAADSYEAVARYPEKYLSKEQIADGVKRAIAAIKKDYGKDSLGKEMIESLQTGNLKDATPEAREYIQKELISLLPTGPHIMPLYVRAENPFDYDNQSHVGKVVLELNKTTDSNGRMLGSKMFRDIENGKWDAIEDGFVQDAIKALGFDSFYVEEQGRKNLAVYEPNQVKSATGNVGTYSLDSNDVRYSLRNVAFPTAKEATEAADAVEVPDTIEFKRYIAGNQWVDEEGKAKKFYHATTSNFFEFNEGVIYLSDTAEEAEKWGRIAEDRLREQVYRALNKDEKLPFFQKAVDEAVSNDKITQAQGERFMRDAGRKIPEFGSYDLIKKEMDEALLSLAPERMKIMPLYARAVTPFDFRNKEHVQQVMAAYNYTQEMDRKIGEVAKQVNKEIGGAPTVNVENILDGLKGILAQGYPKVVERPDIIRTIRKLGFDGYITRRNRNAPMSYAVFKPEQVKSVTGNDGKFDVEKKDIRYSLPSVAPQINARVDMLTTAREQKGFAQRMIEAISPKTFSSFRQSYLNRYEQLSRYDKLRAEQMGGAVLLADQSAESAALMSDLASGVAASAMGYGDRNGGVPVYRNGTTVIDRSVKGLIASLAPLAKYGDPKVYQYYQFWAGAKRAERLKAEGRERLYTQSDFAYARTLQTQFPEFVDVQRDLIAFNNGIVNYMVQTQVLSPEMGRKYTEHADYIPFYRQMDGERTSGPNIFSAISGVRPPKKLKGGDTAVADLLENLVRNTQSSIQAGMKNAAANRAIKVVSDVVASGNVPGVDLVRLNTQETGDNIINVLENGKLVSYKTTDKLLVEAVGSLNMSELPFMGLISGPSNLLRNLVTKDPGFMMANLIRDSLSAYVTSGQNMTPIAGTMANFAKALARKSPGYEALLDAGVIGGYELSQNVEQSGESLARDLDKKAGRKDPILMRPFTSLWNALETGTTASDAATRAMVYERVLAETGNEAEALYRALEVMNFNRKGNSPLIRVLTAAVPFFNARLQGLDLFYRASTGNMNTNDAKAIQRKFFLRGSTMMALSVMYYMMVADDEEYKKQEQETKDGNWIIPSLGIRIPIPFEVGVLFKTMPERITAYALGNDTGKDLRDSTVRNLVSTFAFNPIPQTVKPIVEAATNFSFFTMRPIVGQGMGDVDPEFQVGPGTSKVAEMLGRQLGMSPMKIDHILKGYTGTMGIYMVDATDLVMEQFGDSAKANKRFEQLPIIKRFAVDPEARGTVTAYYQLKDAVDTFTRTSNLLEKTSKPEDFVKYVRENAGMLGVKDYVLDLEKEMKELREMRRTITSSSMDGEQKKNLLTTIGRAEQNLTSNIQTVKKVIASTQ
jgi:hypothetical protein